MPLEPGLVDAIDRFIDVIYAFIEMIGSVVTESLENMVTNLQVALEDVDWVMYLCELESEAICACYAGIDRAYLDGVMDLRSKHWG